MGNLQTGDTKPAKSKGKSKVKIKGKKGKAVEDDFTGIVCDQEPDTTVDITVHEEEEEIKPLPPEPPDTLMVNHSWSNVEDDETKKPFTTPISSSDSNFTEALTPQAFSRQTEGAINFNVDVPNSTHESFLHNLALNSFKLNEYRARHEEEKTKKLSKLGVSKTSQISLDSDLSECFVSDNVEIIRQIYNDSGYGWDKCAELQENLKQAEHDFKNNKDEEAMMVSDVSIANGEFLF